MRTWRRLGPCWLAVSSATLLLQQQQTPSKSCWLWTKSWLHSATLKLHSTLHCRIALWGALMFFAEKSTQEGLIRYTPSINFLKFFHTRSLFHPRTLLIFMILAHKINQNIFKSPFLENRSWKINFQSILSIFTGFLPFLQILK